MYKVEVLILYIITEPIFWVYNAQVTPVLSISWLLVSYEWWYLSRDTQHIIGLVPKTRMVSNYLMG